MNGQSSQVIGEFSPNQVPPGFKILIEPLNPIFIKVPINKKSFNSFKVWITDDQLNTVNFNGENVSMTLWLRSV